MNRRWQKDAVDKYRTLESFNTFLARLEPLDDTTSLPVCDPADLYSVLSVLHSKARNPQLQVNKSPGFYYFLADAVQPPGGLASPAPAEHGGGQVGDDHVRREAVVPISSKSSELTVDTLAKCFQLEAHANVSHILLAIVDDDGSVSLVRVFNYVQPPFEGPETLPPLESEAAGGVSDVEE
ncbi:hypothetical protein HYH03_012202 [Edaphochlamys debaryana]|uniref:tRNA-splicing endonuclease subunit Sen15 domain-containing protein n=1 Tax=Edaphochlamys debaryana TaxID=47281 RepID=A0A836BUU3_9CHLO|nr:hypothetical protein HYH03_012202 [Edaphochlamys debaryana]|eukprot:KAG2489372.1 hypothetical protein HYH03_012202 [Edaphochlamys debaryana]